MPNELIDISLNISERSVVWPTAPRPSLTPRLSMARGDAVNDSNLFMNVHTGTHIDAPRHHLQDGASTEAVPLEALVGEAWVVDLTGCAAIDVAWLQRLWPRGPVTRLLCKTSNSRYWENGAAAFVPDYCALTVEAAAWLVQQRVQLVGIDYLSIQRYEDPPTVHRVLLAAGIVLVEGLNLSSVSAGRYELFCLPLKLVGADGAPARAVLRRLS